jgi:hypothetical protein
MATMNEFQFDTPSLPLELRHASTDRPMIVVVPERRLLAIDGLGPASAAGFRMATSVLRAVDASVRVGLHRDWFSEGPKGIIEIVWLTDPSWSPEDVLRAFAEGEPLRWRQMIELRASATAAGAEAAIRETRTAAGRDVPLVRLIAVTEGRAAQLLHLGGATSLSATIAQLYGSVAESGLRPRGPLHQLLFRDPDAISPTEIRSILRLPIE